MFKPPKGLWSQPWSPALLRPEIARLVARPILMLTFARFGGSPIEFARKQSAIVNGAGSAWVDTPYGVGMYFPNATFSAPTDYLTFRGNYPLSNGTIVPHSVALLYAPRTTNGGQYPFALGSNDTGTRSLGINCDFGGNKFNVVHFGVVGFASIGNTPVSGRYYLQMYSYDQVTMNHMVVDLTTGAVASQSIAETRALITASPGPYVGYVGGNEAMQGNIVGVAWVRGAWTINEMEILARNPTAIWTSPRRRRLGYKSASGPTTYTVTGAGGLSIGGAGTAAITRQPHPAGGLMLAGAGTVDVIKQPHPAGGLTVGGAATGNVKKAIVGAGGLVEGGAAIVSRTKASIGAGGLVIAGQSLVDVIRRALGSGGLTIGGHGLASEIFVPHPSGGLVIGGVADAAFRGRFIVVGSGGLTIGGAATVNRTRVIIAAGGLSVAGHAPASRSWLSPTSGGFTIGGATLARRIYAVRVAGGILIGGAADALYIFGGTIPAAFIGRVFIFPQFIGRVGAAPQLGGRVVVEPDR